MLKNIKILILTCSIAQICTSEIQPAARASTVFWNKSTQPIVITDPKGSSDPSNSFEITDRTAKELSKIRSSRYFTSLAKEDREKPIQPAKQESKGGSKLTIQLKRTKQQPRIQRRDLAIVQKIFKNQI